MPVLAGGRRGGRWCTRGVAGALNRWTAPNLGSALCLHPVRTQRVGSTAVVPIAHSRRLVEHLQVNGCSLRRSPPPPPHPPRLSLLLLSSLFNFLLLFAMREHALLSFLRKERERKKNKSRSSYTGTTRSSDGTGVRCRCRCMTRRSRVRTEGRERKKSQAPVCLHSPGGAQDMHCGATGSTEERGGATNKRTHSSPT